MELKFIDSGTNLTIQFMTKNDELISECVAIFHNNLGRTSFWAESEELFNSFNEPAVASGDVYLRISFFRSPSLYSFMGRAQKTLVEKGRFLTEISQISDMKTSSRRLYPRLEIFIPVTLSTTNREMLIQGQSLDISVDGLCFLANDPIPESETDSFYLLEFVLNRADRFLLSSKLVRRGDSPILKQFKYDYGFLFDHSVNPDNKSRLVTSLFTHKINGRR